MTVALRLSAEDVRLVRLALLYHLARPGAEFDASTGQLAEHGLTEVDAALAEREDAAASLELTDGQLRRLLEAMLGCVNELRVYHLNGGAASMVPRFNETARRSFPAIADDPEAALDVAESMLMLRRRLAQPGAGNERPSRAAEPPKRSRWPFRRQS
ncbi:MAG: hypothetical protein EPO22_07735 [Dehalococcoidia bacterium]|nr:MAG: hypothetical protein EPO22_07735 [Dehalococcoidia bacterium]